MVVPEEAVSSDTLKSGIYVRTVSSRSSLPISTSLMIAVPVNVLVIEPIWNRVSSVIGKGCSILVTPELTVTV